MYYVYNVHRVHVKNEGNVFFYIHVQLYTYMYRYMLCTLATCNIHTCIVGLHACILHYILVQGPVPYIQYMSH